MTGSGGLGMPKRSQTDGALEEAASLRGMRLGCTILGAISTNACGRTH